MTKKKTRPKTKSARPFDLTQGSGKILTSLWKVNKAILSALDFEKLTESVVNVVLEELNYLKIGYRISVLTVVDKKAGIVRRISFSPTPEALEILRRAKIKFHDIKIPLNTKENLLVKAIKNKKVYVTHDLSDVFYPEKTRDIWRQLQHQVGIKTSLVFPLIIKGKSFGAMIFSLSKSEKEVSDYEKGVLGGFTDAVAVALENASLYRRLKKTNKRLKEVSALKDEFVSLTSHELRTPLTAISGSLSTVLEGFAGKINDQTKEFLSGAHSEATRLTRLVNNLLNISRIEAGRLKFNLTEFDLSKVIEQALESLQPQADEKKLQLSFYSPEIKVKADEDKVREIVINLTGNAIKFTDKGEVRVSAHMQDSLVLVAVEDTGRGILAEDQPKLFKKFERVDRVKAAKQKGGTGLGLYICRNLLEGMGGEIWLKSVHGKGSTFYFVLPLAV